MSTVRWDPYADLLALKRDVDRLLRHAGLEEGTGPEGTWTPAVDVLRRGDDIVVRVEVPGVDVRRVEVTVEDDVLTVRGERPRRGESEGEVLVRESAWGVFERDVLLPTRVPSHAVRAEYRGGMLEIVAEGAAVAGPRRVEIAAPRKHPSSPGPPVGHELPNVAEPPAAAPERSQAPMEPPPARVQEWPVYETPRMGEQAPATPTPPRTQGPPRAQPQDERRPRLDSWLDPQRD